MQLLIPQPLTDSQPPPCGCPLASGCPLKAKNPGTPAVSKLLKLPVQDIWAPQCSSLSPREGPRRLCQILNVSARPGGLCPGSPNPQGGGETLPCRETPWSWPHTLCAQVSIPAPPACSRACFQLHPQAETPGAEAQQHLSPGERPGLDTAVCWPSPSCSPGWVPSVLRPWPRWG